MSDMDERAVALEDFLRLPFVAAIEAFSRFYFQSLGRELHWDLDALAACAGYSGREAVACMLRQHSIDYPRGQKVPH